MKNIIIKNLVKNMAGYGEMLNKVGIWSENFHTQFLEDKNMTMKNIIKTMQNIGEMTACIGNL